MKSLLILIFALTSLHSFAGSDPEICGGKNTCIKNRIFFTGVYYSRGVGATCSQAYENSVKVFDRAFGEVDCGLFTGPVETGCYDYKNGQFSVWSKCNPRSKPGKKQSGCVDAANQYIPGCK